MRVISPRIEVLTPLNAEKTMRKIELIGRVCYKSEDRITSGSAEKFCRNVIKRGHESVIEHESISVRIICDRGISHELVRHRLASYSQESSRYCNYSKGAFGAEITVIKPCFLEEGTRGYAIWFDSCRYAEQRYFDLLDWGCTPEQARDVLPTSLKTEVVMTANLREWRHFLRLRTAQSAHPQMREVAGMIFDEFYKAMPVFFEDLPCATGQAEPETHVKEKADADCEVVKIIDLNDIVGIYPIANTGGIVIYNIDSENDRVLAGLNAESAEWWPMKTVDDTPGFMFDELFIPFSEVMRI